MDKIFGCPICKNCENAISFMFSWTPRGRNRFRKYLKVYHHGMDRKVVLAKLENKCGNYEHKSKKKFKKTETAMD